MKAIIGSICIKASPNEGWAGAACANCKISVCIFLFPLLPILLSDFRFLLFDLFWFKMHSSCRTKSHFSKTPRLLHHLKLPVVFASSGFDKSEGCVGLIASMLKSLGSWTNDVNKHTRNSDKYSNYN